MSKLRRPYPLGYGASAREAHTIAAPLLAAAALSLAGVVAGAGNTTFLWPGPTLLLLIATSLALIASIQLHYHARQFFYSRADIQDWYEIGIEDQTNVYDKLCEWQSDDHRRWSRFSFAAVWCFDFGTVLLGLGVAAVLLPPGDSRQGWWRLSAACIVLLCTIADAMWTVQLYQSGLKLQRSRLSQLAGIMEKTGEEI